MASSAPDELSPRAQEIVAAARELLDDEGLAGLSMRRLADRLGIRAPSLYKHFADKQALEAAIISAAIATGYRAFARGHPHLYRLMTERPLHRDRLVPGVEDRAARPLYEALGQDRDLARATWAFAHGMANLELSGRFPPDADLDAAWARGVAAFRPGRGVG